MLALHLADHAASAHERGHRFQQGQPPVKDTGAHWRDHFVAGKGVEVAAERLNVHRHVGHALGAVDEDGRARLVCPLHDRGGVGERSQAVGDMRERDQLRLAAQQGVERVEVKPAVGRQLDKGELGSLLFGEELPGDQIRVVLHDRQHDQVAGADVLPPPRLGDQIDCLRRVADENALAGGSSIDEVGDEVPRLLEVGGRPAPRAGRRRGGCWHCRPGSRQRGRRSPAPAFGSWRRCRERRAAAPAHSPG